MYGCIKDGDGGVRAKERELKLERHVLEVETCFSNTNLTRHDGNLLGSLLCKHPTRIPQAWSPSSLMKLHFFSDILGDRPPCQWRVIIVIVIILTIH